MHFSTGLIFLLTALGIVFYYLQKQKEKDDGEQKNSSMSSQFDQGSVHKEEHGEKKDSSSSSLLDNQCRRFSLDEIKLATNGFDDAFVIGKGGFGNVYKGRIDFGEGIDVAIKRLNLDSNQGATEFRAEIEMLSRFRHSHIVSLLGYHEEYDNKEMILVYEYMPNGSLEDHLHKIRANGSNSSLLTWVQRLHICIGAARGLDYLHTGTGVQSRVIHRDVKSSNILLDENLAAKISDFGLSRIGPANQSGTTNVYTDLIRGTFGYMDAEYFATHRLTRKSDVYAFGVVLLEVLCGRPALDFTLAEEQHSLAVWANDCIKDGKIDQIIDPSLKGQTTANCLKEFARIANECILTRSKDRPTMTKVMARLEFVLALASRKHGGETIAEKVWSLFSIKNPVVHAKNFRNRLKWSNDNKIKQAIQDKPTTTMAEGSSDGKDNGIILVDPTKTAAEGSIDNINEGLTVEESTEEGSSDYIKEVAIINKPVTTAEASNDGIDKGIIIVYPAKTAAEVSGDNINEGLIVEEPIEDRGSDHIKEGAVVNKPLTTAIECNHAAIMLKTRPSSSQIGDHNLKIFTYDELRRATRNFRPSAMIGVSHGRELVYKGWVDTESYTPSVFGVGIAVAIKVSNTQNVQSLNEWQAEVNRGKFRHPNLVKLLGYCSQDKMLLLVHEYIPKRNFRDIIHCYPSPWGRTMKIVIGVAKGLAFLHIDESTPISRTFNTSNILFNKDNEPQLYFGWAFPAQVRGPLPTNRYNPPEYMATGHWYVKSDVYAFGVIMLDMIVLPEFHKYVCGSSPESLLELAIPILSDKRKLQKIMNPLLMHGDTPKGASKAGELILSCLEIAPENRPTMQEIVAILQVINAMDM